MVEQKSSPTIPPAARPFQFSLSQLLAAFFVVCTFFGAYSALGMLGATLWISAAGLFGALVGILRGNNVVVAVSILLSVVFILLMPAEQGNRGSPRSHCMNNLRQIGNTLERYHKIHGSFPQAYIVDETGKPIHSWRAIILRNLGEQQLYDEYDFSEPWNGPNNGKLADGVIKDFHCPADRSARANADTNYLAIVGPGTAWPGATGAKLSDLKGKASETILVVEVVGANISWMEPRDLHISAVEQFLNDKKSKVISSMHKNGTNVLFADGRVAFLTYDELREAFRKMLMRQADAR